MEVAGFLPEPALTVQGHLAQRLGEKPQRKRGALQNFWGPLNWESGNASLTMCPAAIIGAIHSTRLYENQLVRPGPRAPQPGWRDESILSEDMIWLHLVFWLLFIWGLKDSEIYAKEAVILGLAWLVCFGLTCLPVPFFIAGMIGLVILDLVMLFKSGIANALAR
jgi:hypothetical protein